MAESEGQAKSGERARMKRLGLSERSLEKQYNAIQCQNSVHVVRQS